MFDISVTGIERFEMVDVEKETYRFEVSFQVREMAGIKFESWFHCMVEVESTTNLNLILTAAFRALSVRFKLLKATADQQAQLNATNPGAEFHLESES